VEKTIRFPSVENIQVRIIALTGGNLFRDATNCRDFPIFSVPPRLDVK